MTHTTATRPQALPALLLGASLALMAACGAEPPATGNAKGQSSCDSRAYSEIGGPVSLINQDGQRVTQADFAGHPALVYFGFTYCPDVCPLTLVTLRRALDLLPEGVEHPAVILITIDPARDTPEALKAYVSTEAFPKGMVGLTGTDAEIAAVAKAFRAGYNRVDDPGSAAGYTMDHTSIVYLMDGNWQLQTFFTHETTPEAMSACLAEKLPRS